MGSKPYKHIFVCPCKHLDLLIHLRLHHGEVINAICESIGEFFGSILKSLMWCINSICNTLSFCLNICYLVCNVRVNVISRFLTRFGRLFTLYLEMWSILYFHKSINDDCGLAWNCCLVYMGSHLLHDEYLCWHPPHNSKLTCWSHGWFTNLSLLYF